MVFQKKQLKNDGWFGKFSPLRHCESVTDVTGVAIRFFLSPLWKKGAPAKRVGD